MKICSNCILPESYPGIRFDSNGICNYCHDYRNNKENEDVIQFESEKELIRCLKKYKNPGQDYDILVAVSGGLDSSYALIKMVEDFQLRPLVYHNDHGYEDPVAAENVKKLCKIMDVDLIIWQLDLEFMKKLWKYFNEVNIEGMSACYICGNVLYFNALEVAQRFNIPLVVNGYSKGQALMMQDQVKGRGWMADMMEFILAKGDEPFFNRFTRKFKMLSNQKIYRSRKDMEEPGEPGKILVLPFYIFKFYQTNKEQLKKECIRRFDWRPIRLSYPSRTTNCDMIWLNTYCDLEKRKYSLYQEEYATMVRAGDMTREQALKDLEFNPPPGLLERLASEIHLDLP